MRQIEEAAAAGLKVTAQVAARAIGVMLGLELTPASLPHTAILRPQLPSLPLAERVAKLRDSAVKARILAEDSAPDDEFAQRLGDYSKVFTLGNPPDYEQPTENAIGPRAAREGRNLEEIAYDAMLEDDGQGMLYMPALNYADGNLDPVYEMMRSPLAIAGLSDGGAHCGIICDASFPTYLLTHWARDRTRGERLSLPYVVELQTRKSARRWGCMTEAWLRPAIVPTLNVIDFDRLRLLPPEVSYDLPLGGRRLVQTAEGYEVTIVAGIVTRRDGAATGALPGGWC